MTNRHPHIRRQFLLLAVLVAVTLQHVALGAYLAVSPARWRTILEQAIGRRVGLAARLQTVELVSLGHFRLRGLTIGMPEVRHREDPHLKVASIDVRIDLLGLLWKTGRPDSVEVSGLDGRLTASFVEHLGSHRAGVHAESLPRAITVADAELSIADGTLYRDSPQLRLSDVQMDMRALSNMSSEYQVRLSLQQDVVEEVRVEGRVEVNGGQFHARVQCLNLELGKPLEHLLPTSAKPLWQKLRPGGRGDLEIQLTGNFRQGRLEVPTGSISLSGAEITHQVFPYRVPDLVGRVSWHGHTITLSNLIGHSGSSIIEIGGQISRRGNGVRPTLRITANDVPLDERVRESLNESVRSVWDRFQPSGRMDVTSYVLPSPDGTPSKVDVRTACRANGVAMTFAQLPLEVSGLVGNVIITSDLFALRQMRGICLGEPVVIDGEIGWGEQKRRRVLRIEAEHFSLNDAFRAAMPEAVRRVLDDLAVAGRVSFVVDVDFGLDEDPDSPTRATFRGKATLEGVALKAHWMLEGVNGEASFSGSVPKHGWPEIDVDVARTRATVRGFDVTDLSAKIYVRERNIAVVSVHASTCGGQAYGQFSIPGPDDSPAGARLDFRRIDLQEVLESAGLTNPRMTGLMRGTVDMPGRMTTGETARVAVDLTISEGDLYRIPPLLKLFDLLNLTAATGEVVTDARIILYLRPEYIIVEQMRLTGPDTIPIFGQGKVGYDGELELKFITGRGKGFVREFLVKLPVVGMGVELVDSTINKFTRVILSSVVQVNVTGTFMEPKGTITTFSKVTPEMRDFIMEAHKEISPRLRGEGASGGTGER